MHGRRAVATGTLPATMNTPAGTTWKKGIPGGTSQFTTDWYWDTGLTTLNSVTTYTYSFWGRKNATSSIIGLGVATAGGTSQSNRDSALMFSDGTSYLSYGAGYYAFGGWGQSTAWRHMIVCYDGNQSANATKYRVYMDGIPITGGTYNGTVPTSSVSHSGATFIIGRDPGLPNYSRGFFDDVRVWNRSLSPAEAYTVYMDSLTGFSQTFLDSQVLSPIKTRTLNNYVLTATTGTFTLTGNSAGLTQSKILPASTGSFALTGNDASVTVQRKIVADPGSFTLTGNDATFALALRLSASVGAFTLTGNDAALTSQRKITATTGSFALTGNAAALNAGKALSAATGSFALTGNDASLKKGLKLATSTGVVTLAGNAAGLTTQRRLASEAGSFALSGVDSSLTVQRTIAASTGSFTLAGEATSLLCARVILPATGAFTLTGNSVTFTYVFPADFVRLGLAYISVPKISSPRIASPTCDATSIRVPKTASAYIESID